jgi:DNA-binding response OmpR family regulator
MFKIGGLELDSYKKTVRRSGKEIFLSAKEFSMLELLIKNKNKVLSRSYIAEAI